MAGKSLCGIYDFELLPYALGDVLTWNVQSALRREEAGREQVDVFICMDRSQPASIYQRNLVVADNCDLYFSELFGAFNTHPALGNVHLFGSRDQMLDGLHSTSRDDAVNTEVVADYERVLASRTDESILNEYFIKNIYSHERLNQYFFSRGHIPLLSPSRGCEPDIASLIKARFSGKYIVVIHPRLRRLDYGMGGGHTYARDSDFLEWYEFVRIAGEKHPEVQFVVVGRLQEKPIELLRLPNVTSLRALGLGLGHDLTLILNADLFIGTSSGFAAMANFSTLPYFITKMNKESCSAYGIEPGSTRLLFAGADQVLVYETESTDMLMDLLEKGLPSRPRHASAAESNRNVSISIGSHERERARGLHPAATTNRFFIDDIASDQETAFLVWPKLVDGLPSSAKSDVQTAYAITHRIARNFPRLPGKFTDFERLAAGEGPPLIQRLRAVVRNYVEGINSTILPPALLGTRFHVIARQLKHTLLRYR